jgi:hypothetical protein
MHNCGSEVQALVCCEHCEAEISRKDVDIACRA